MLAAALFFAIMGMLVKTASTHYTSAELVFYRSLFGLLVIGIIASKQRLSLRSPVMGKQLARGGLGFISLLMFFFAISKLPLATAITLNHTSALFMAVFTPFILHERPGKRLVAAILLGLIGVALLLRPTFYTGEWLAGGVGLLSGLIAGVVYLYVTQLGRAGEPDWRTVFYFTLISTLGAGIWMLADRINPITWQTLPLLLGIGASATIAQLLMTRAYRTGQHLVVGSLIYCTIMFASLFGIVFWNEMLSADRWLAIALIITGGIFAIISTPKAR